MSATSGNPPPPRALPSPTRLRRAPKPQARPRVLIAPSCYRSPWLGALAALASRRERLSEPPRPRYQVTPAFEPLTASPDRCFRRIGLHGIASPALSTFQKA